MNAITHVAAVGPVRIGYCRMAYKLSQKSSKLRTRYHYSLHSFCVCVCVVIMSPVSMSSHVVCRVGQSGPEKQSQEAHLFASMSERLQMKRKQISGGIGSALCQKDVFGCQLSYSLLTHFTLYFRQPFVYFRYGGESWGYFYDIDAHSSDMSRSIGGQVPYIIDAMNYGNVSRYINHR